MTTSEHLWAVGYDDIGRANQVRDEIIRLVESDLPQLQPRRGESLVRVYAANRIASS